MSGYKPVFLTKCGVYFYYPDNKEVDVYLLEPTGDTCIWAPDLGLADGIQNIWWETDEWQGHIPVWAICQWSHPDDWKFLREFS
jgi:hypothetical protein